MRRYRTRLAIIVAALAVTTVAASCGDDGESTSGASTPSSNSSPSSGASDGTDSGSDDGAGPAPQPLASPETLKVTVSVNAEFAFALYVAQQKGEFAKENLTVEIPIVPSAAQFQALAGGQVDIVAAGVSAIGLNSVAQGVDAITFLNTHDGPAPGSNEGLWVRNEFKGPNGKIDPAKVDGMRVVLGTQQLANSNVFALQKMLEEVGKDIDDVELTVLQPGADSVIALENEAVDVAQELPPFSDSPSLPNCCFLAAPGVSAGKYWAMTKELDERREVFEAFARALLRTNRLYLQGNYHSKADTAQLLSQFTGAPMEQITAAKSFYKFGTELLNETEIVEPLQTVWLDHSPNGEILSYKDPMPLDKIATQEIVDTVNGE